MENVPIYNAVTGEGCEFKPLLKAMTSASIIFTTFVFGGGAYYILPHLGIHPHNEEHPSVVETGTDISSLDGVGAAGDHAPTSKKKVSLEMAPWRWTLCHYDGVEKRYPCGQGVSVSPNASQHPLPTHSNPEASTIGPRESARKMPSIIDQHLMSNPE